MKKHFVHTTGGRTCSSAVAFDYEDGLIHNVEFIGGCDGNTTGIAMLSEGRTPEELISKLSGITCQGSYSCPNEFAMALKEMLSEL